MVLEAACGGSSPGLFGSSVHPGSSSRTAGTQPGVGWMPFVGTWRTSGTQAYRSRLRRAISAHGTSANASSSLLPTLTASSYGSSGNGSPGDGREEYAHEGTPSLQTLARQGLLPTLLKSDTGGKRTNARGEPQLSELGRMGLLPTLTVSGNYNRKGVSEKSGDGLATAVARLMPTLKRDDAKNTGSPSRHNRNTPPLDAVAGGPLNPNWCEAFMGFPQQWTEVSEVVAPESRNSATPSVRRSPKPSGG